LLLIDGFNIVRRIYEALAQTDPVKQAERTVSSSIASFSRALEEHKSSHVLAAFDYGGPTWRHQLYPAYRAHRPPMPEPLKNVLPEIFGGIEKLGIRTVLVPGVEADDVLAAVFRHWRAAGRGQATILSTDKDLLPLVAEGVCIWDHFGRFWRNEAWILEKFGVGSAVLQDLFALTGDATDGIPGVPGVGLKTAAKWLRAYGSLEQILARAEEIPGKAGDALRAHIKQVRLSRKLVDFHTDIKIGVTWNELRREPKAA